MSVTSDNPSCRTLSSTFSKYHVFLSFRGKDVRRTFVDHLYASLKNAGVNAFLDSHDIESGDEISSAVHKAIHNSDILIPILSRNFAESHWCLDEVAHMCKANGIIIPLFYDVKPNEVRNPWRGVYAKAFEGKKQRYTPERISVWESALRKVSSFSGWCTYDITGFAAELVKLIVQDVFKILNQNVTPLEEALPQPLDEDPSDTILQEIRNEPLRISKTILMGMEEHMSKVIKMLNADSDENVLTVAIYGNGGVGKTSLAKAIHNHIYLKFDATCFVYDVRHKAQNTNGVTKMQRQILKDLVKFKDKVNDEAHGKMLMKGRLRSIKALVILEYVDDWKQLEALRGDWFGPGSRVLVTTLDPNILKNENGSLVYELQGLAKEHALQFFSWHAFMRDQPEEDYKELSCKAVDICNRLPFSLEVLGAHLYNRDLSQWKQAIKTLENSAYHGKNAILRLCYDGLEPEEKEMFLDMACLFIGGKRESVISFWEANHLYPNVGLTNLKLKSLIKLDEHDRFVMHSELRDMGRAIVAEESAEPGKRSRLWKPEEVEPVIMEGKETHCLELLSFSANGVPECLEKKMGTNGNNLLYVTLDSTEQCSGIILCFMVSFKGGISSVDVELGTLRDGKEIFNTRLVNHSKIIEGDQIFVHILHKNHPMVMMVQSGDVVQAKADRDEERMLIRSGGMQFFSEGEDGKREDLILEILGKGLTMLMEDYYENLVFEDEE